MSSAEPDQNSASSATTPIKRLPTHYRRRRVPLELRKRTARACNSCNVKRVKCSGDHPCARCVSRSVTCEYPDSDTEQISVNRKTYEDLQKTCSLLQQCLADAVPSERTREALMSKWGDSSTALPSSRRSNHSRGDENEQQETGDGRILQDPDGYTRYLGESSGAAFMDRLREFVGRILPLLSDTNGITFANMEGMFTSLIGQYHTHDSRPLLMPDVDPFYLPDPEEITKLVNVFRFYAEDGAGAFLCGGIYYWGNLRDLAEQAQKAIPLSGAREDILVLCNLNAVMGLACQYNPSLALPWETYPGETYFARAKLLLTSPMEDASLAHVSALSLMGHYLLGLYRRDAAYLYIGLAARISMVHGLHKGWMINDQSKLGEQCKREFWNTFILDRWLSCLMGRPATIAKEAISIDLPVDLPGIDLPPATGLREHVKLSMIMDEIVNTVYGVASRKLDYAHTLSNVDAALDKLSTWQAELPLVLQLQADSTIPDRANLILHMMFNQLVLLCTRPILFLAVKQAVAAKYISRNAHRQPKRRLVHIKYCTDAARSITTATRQLMVGNQAAVLAPVDYHFPYSAAIVLELARLLPDISPREDEDDISFLVMYLQQSGDKGNESARDCGNMVLEFGAVVTRLLHDRKRPSTSSAREKTTSPNAMAESPFEGNYATTFAGDVFTPGTQAMARTVGSLDTPRLPEGQGNPYDQLFSWFSDSLQ